MNYSFLEAAKEELEEAIRYYEEQREGLTMKPPIEGTR